MDRREAFLGLLAMLAAGVPLLATAQDARKAYRVGILGFSGARSGPSGPQPADRSTAAFLDGMRALGYRYGEHFVTELRGPGGNPERLPALAAELVRQQPDVIIAGGGLPAVALKQATSTIPIVMAASVDPVGQGLVQSLARPGGYTTGVYMLTSALNGKRLQLLHEMVPRAGTIGVPINPASPGVAAAEAEVRAAAAAASVRLLVLHASTEREIDTALATLTAKRIGALMLSNDPFFNSRREQLVTLTARALGLPIPQSLLLRADEVIQ